VSNLQTGAGVGGATVTVTSTATQTSGSATSAGDGYYAVDGVGVGGPTTITYTAPRFNGFSATGVMLSNGEIRNQALAPFFNRSGLGNTVFDLPSYVSRLRIRGVWQRRDNSNFIVYISDRLVVNEILRTSITYDGIHQVPAGNRIVRIESSGAIQWTFDQEQ
jgi:hypothetical protein